MKEIEKKIIEKIDCSLRCGYFSKLSCLLYDTMARTTANNVFAFAQNLIFSRISVGGGGGSAGNGNDVRPIRSRRVRRFFVASFSFVFCFPFGNYTDDDVGSGRIAMRDQHMSAIFFLFARREAVHK